MDLTPALEKLSVFVPELAPLIPTIVAAVATGEKIHVIIQPALDRLEAGEVALIEAAEAAPALEAILPEIASAIKVGKQLQELVASYQSKLNLKGS